MGREEVKERHSIRGDRCRVFLLAQEQGRPTWGTIVRREFAWARSTHWDCALGGSIQPGERPEDAAVRELEEETGLKDIPLVKFAQCIIQGVRTDHFFRGFYPKDETLQCSDGVLRWVPTATLSGNRLEPITRLVVQRWVRQGFSATPPWTVRAFAGGVKDCVLHVRVIDTKRGLS